MKFTSNVCFLLHFILNFVLLLIYLVDNNNYVSRVSTILTSTKLEDKIKEIINILTIGSNNYIREGFKKVIPKNTKLLNLEIQDQLVKLNFSKELLNVEQYTKDKETYDKFIDSYRIIEINIEDGKIIFKVSKSLQNFSFSSDNNGHLIIEEGK